MILNQRLLFLFKVLKPSRSLSALVIPQGGVAIKDERETSCSGHPVYLLLQVTCFSTVLDVQVSPAFFQSQSRAVVMERTGG